MITPAKQDARRLRNPNRGRAVIGLTVLGLTACNPSAPSASAGSGPIEAAVDQHAVLVEGASS